MTSNFLLNCKKCKWFRKCEAKYENLKDLVEFKACKSCHEIKKYKCPKCSSVIKLERINSI